MITHKKSDLIWTSDGDSWYLVDSTRPFSNEGYINKEATNFYVAYYTDYIKPGKTSPYFELGFFDNLYDAKRAIEKAIPGFYQ